MENSRNQINLSAGTFTNLYTAASLTVGTKLGLQNLSSDPIIITIGTSGDASKGYIVNPLEYALIPAGVSGCFIKTVTGDSGVIAIDKGGYNIPNFAIDERVYDGNKALTVQTFTEANSKNGSQFSMTTRNIAVAAGSTLDVMLTTGAKTVLTKGLVVQYTGSQIETSLYKGVVATGGQTVPSYNLNTELLTTMLSTFKTSNGAAFTITNAGVQVAPAEFFYGIADQGNRSTPSFITAGIERVLQPNTVYMRRIWNRSANPCVIDFSATFYEGDISSQNG